MSAPILPDPVDPVKVSLDAWQASINAETVKAQQQEIRDLNAGLAEMAREKNRVADELKALKLELSIAVVKLANGKRTTLWSILESESYRPVCTECRETDCTGCIPTHIKSPRAIEAVNALHEAMEARIA